MLVRIHRWSAYVTRLEIRLLVTSCAWSCVNPPYTRCCTGYLVWTSSSRKHSSSSVMTVTAESNISVLIIVQRDATQSSLFIILQVHSTCFGCQPHPSSGVHKTVTTASGTGHIFCAATCLQRGQLGNAQHSKTS